MADISRDTVVHLGRLNRLHVDTQTADRMAGQLDAIVDYVAALQKVTVTPDARSRAAMGVSKLTNVLADDELRPSDSDHVDAAAFFAQIPRGGISATGERSFQVRAVLVGEEESA
jgi:aspartyl-tRNA(Asn)/glutamyl-tRNA(Gln) amidotransferase subunit C